MFVRVVAFDCTLTVTVAVRARRLGSAPPSVDRRCIKSKGKGKGRCIYIALTRKALRHGSHSVTCNYTNACLYLGSVYQMAPPQTEVAHI